ncbi:glycosylase [Larkinella bovis]|uniref:Glycosylase n=1 Tax=Larkinella bovis TaxID=683041 RepID=A0ABW0I599_9BACT
MKKTSFLLLLTAVLVSGIALRKPASNPEFPSELVHFKPYAHNPVFAGTGAATWDQQIRERGYILREGRNWYLWYTGYQKGGDKTKYLGLATSTDGFTWKRSENNPIHQTDWVEDMSVWKDGNTYYMFAEGRDDIAHLLTSTDRIHWTEKGPIDIRLKNGTPLSKGPYGTPAIWKEKGVWYLFYERNDAAVWLATSKDLKTWTNVQDEPVLNCGPEAYDQFAVAANQIIHYKGFYYMYYHASAFKDWREWSTNLAVSSDLIHWKKYDKNPIVKDNTSSGILVNDGSHFRLYTMHPEVKVFLPAAQTTN